MDASSKHLILRCCKTDGTSYGGFKWPMKVGAVVECPDWDPEPECGNGLHGWLDGQGDLSACDWWDDATAVWLVVEADTIVQLNGKVKAPSVTILFVGDRQDACNWLAQRRPGVMFACASAGDHGTASAGDYGTASAGSYGTASAGDGGTASAGYRGTASAGDGGTASAGDGGTASAGYAGTASAGDHGTASAEYGGTIQIKRWDGSRYRIVTGYVGEDGIEANVLYKLDDSGKLIRK